MYHELLIKRTFERTERCVCNFISKLTQFIVIYKVTHLDKRDKKLQILIELIQLGVLVNLFIF